MKRAQNAAPRRFNGSPKRRGGVVWFRGSPDANDGEWGKTGRYSEIEKHCHTDSLAVDDRERGRLHALKDKSDTTSSFNFSHLYNQMLIILFNPVFIFESFYFLEIVYSRI